MQPVVKSREPRLKEILKLLQYVPVIKELDDDEIFKVAREFKVEIFAEEKILFKQVKFFFFFLHFLTH